MWRVAGLLRSSRRELSDFEDAFQMDSRGLVSRTAGRVAAPDRLQNPHTQRFEFAYEKSQLLKILEVDWNARTEDAWKPHPMFGKMTPKEWGKLLQIHVDYHLRQFAA